MAFRCGTVAVIGKPNVGKSTLMNFLVGEKVSITSSRPQTTRLPLLGVANVPGAQVLFLDTAGIHQAHTKLGKVIVDTAIQTLLDADAILWVVDVSKSPDTEDKWIAQILKEHKLKNVVVALNKMDRLRPEYVQAHYDAYCALGGDAEVMYTNAMVGENLQLLLEKLIRTLPEGDPKFEDPDYFTNQTVRDMAGELIREKALQNTREEVPHGIAVRIDNWEDPDVADSNPLTKIEATLFCERESQKPILIGNHGAMLQKIGTAARHEIEKLIGTRVFLGLHVKVDDKWRDRPGRWREIGIQP